MLPIVKRKTLEVPHGLAALAAAICLIMAFATDFNARDERLRAEAAAAESAEIVKRSARDEAPASVEDPLAQPHEAGQGPAGIRSMLSFFGLSR